MEYMKPTSLGHSKNKDISLSNLTGGTLELSPGQYIETEFLGKDESLKEGQKVSFVLRTKGYYNKI